MQASFRYIENFTIKFELFSEKDPSQPNIIKSSDDKIKREPQHIKLLNQ